MKEFKPVKVAVIGCGMISDIYLTNMTKRYNALEVVGCSDIKPERSKEKAEKYGIKQMTNEEIWADPEIEIVVNLTYHTSHYEVSKKSMEAGKHVAARANAVIGFDHNGESVFVGKSFAVFERFGQAVFRTIDARFFEKRFQIVEELKKMERGIL